MNTRYPSLTPQSVTNSQAVPVVVPGYVIISDVPRQLPTELAYDHVSEHPQSPPIVAPSMAHGTDNTTTNPQLRDVKDQDTDDNKQTATVPTTQTSHNNEQKLADSNTDIEMKLDDTTAEHKRYEPTTARQNRMRHFFNIQDHAGAQREQSPHLTDPTANNGNPVVANRQLVRAMDRALGNQLRLSLNSNDSSCFVSPHGEIRAPSKALHLLIYHPTHRLSYMNRTIPQPRYSDYLMTLDKPSQFMNTFLTHSLTPMCCYLAGPAILLPMI